ncbi:F0F1 ATP synthase subunit B family protein [Algihabitans albus]|uniref:F0F1 ATP synthase subunit B family protein n=1 Tax=Algihabitans albus TaxID=2164067 RepID=UPI000E5D8683|nr:F0F1 ATP synthase subunit B' [Algihabitans albus]
MSRTISRLFAARQTVRFLSMGTAAVVTLVAATPLLAAEQQGGLPQLTQTDTYAGQIFWTIVTFGILYLVMSKVVIPRIGNAVEERQDKIDDDLTRAGKLKSETEQVIQEYEAALATARDAARETHRKATEAWTKKADKLEQAFADKLANQTSDAEQRISAAKAEALTNLKEVATEISAAATAKLLGEAPKPTDAKKAVEASMTSSDATGGQV